MIKVLFVCLGNICRSPMAEALFKHMVNERCLTRFFEIGSAGTEEYNALVGAGIHSGTKNILKQMRVPFSEHTARYFTLKDYAYFDYIIVMDSRNKADVLSITNTDKDNKIFRLMDFTPSPRDVKDPWYTGNFEETYRDIYEGCSCFLNYLLKNKKIFLDKGRNKSYKL